MKKRKFIIILVGILVLLLGILIALRYRNISADITANPTGDVTPQGATMPGSASLREIGNIYRFEFNPEKNDKKTIYEFDANDPINKSGLLRIKAMAAETTFYPVLNAGPEFRFNETDPAMNENLSSIITSGSRKVTSELLSVNASNSHLVLSYRDTIQKGSSSIKRDRQTTIFLKNRSLLLEINSTPKDVAETDALYNYAGFDLGSPSTTGLRRLLIPFMPNAPVAIVSNKAFSTSYIDLNRSNATGLKTAQPGFYSVGTKYDVLSDSKKTVSRLSEVAYVTSSQHVAEVMLVPNNPRVAAQTRPTEINKMFMLENTVEGRTVPVEPTSSLPDMNQETVAYCATTPAPPSITNPAATMPLAVEGEAFNQYRFNNVNVYLKILGKLGISDIVYGSFRFAGKPSPALLPVCERWGGDTRYKTISDTAISQGQTLIDHQVWQRIDDNFTDRNDSSFSQTYFNAASKDRFGRVVKYSSEPTRLSSATSASGLLSLVTPVVSQIRSKFNIQGTFLDTLPGWTPSLIRKLSYEDGSTTKTLAGAIANMKRFFTSMNQSMPGPIIGEGGKGPERYDTYYAGYVDGVEREHDQHGNADIIPDYELRYIKPKSPLSVGMGWQDRWACQGNFDPAAEKDASDSTDDTLSNSSGEITDSSQLETSLSSSTSPSYEFMTTNVCKYDSVSQSYKEAIFDNFNFDRYRAQVISFGHAHLLPSSMNLNLRNPDEFKKLVKQITKEYYMMDALQKSYLYSKNNSVTYFEDSGEEIGALTTVLIAHPDYNFKQSKLKLVYKNGLEVYINNSAGTSRNWNLNINSKNYTLGSNGFLAYNPNQNGWQGRGKFIAFSGLVSGKQIDYVSSENYQMIDGRGNPQSYEGVQTDGSLKVITKSNKQITCSISCLVTN